jgi:hypothetical protein
MIYKPGEKVEFRKENWTVMGRTAIASQLLIRHPEGHCKIVPVQCLKKVDTNKKKLNPKNYVSIFDRIPNIPKLSAKLLLKDGRVCVTRCGEEYIVFKGKIINEALGFINIRHYDKNLMNYTNLESDNDIMKIKDVDGKEIWTRPTKKGTLTLRYHFLDKEEIINDLSVFLKNSVEEELEITIKNLEG